MTTVSIVLPVYNGERYLRDAIKSVLCQTFQDFELVIVNDASTDKSLDIANFFAKKDNRIIVISNIENKKLPASLNIGFSVARGEYLTWTSDDNALLPNCIERLVEVIEKTGVDVVYADSNDVDGGGCHIQILRRNEPIEKLVYTNVVGACFLYRRDVQDVLSGYDENLFLIEDYDFWCRAYLHGFKFYHIDDVLYVYMRHKNSLSENFTERVLFSRLKYITNTMKIVGDQVIKNSILGEVLNIYKRFYWASSKVEGGLSRQQVLDDFHGKIKDRPFNLFNYHAAAELYSTESNFVAAEVVLKGVIDVFPYWESGVMLLLDVFLKQDKIGEAIALMMNHAEIDDKNDEYKKILLMLLKRSRGG